MSNKFDKFKEIFTIGAAVAQPFVPGAAGSILSKVSDGLNKVSPGQVAAATDAHNHEQDEAILALHERLKAVEAKLR